MGRPFEGDVSESWPPYLCLAIESAGGQDEWDRLDEASQRGLLAEAAGHGADPDRREWNRRLRQRTGSSLNHGG